jgi:hypothetical protein
MAAPPNFLVIAAICVAILAATPAPTAHPHMEEVEYSPSAEDDDPVEAEEVAAAAKASRSERRANTLAGGKASSDGTRRTAPLTRPVPVTRRALVVAADQPMTFEVMGYTPDAKASDWRNPTEAGARTREVLVASDMDKDKTATTTTYLIVPKLFGTGVLAMVKKPMPDDPYPVVPKPDTLSVAERRVRTRRNTIFDICCKFWRRSMGYVIDQEIEDFSDDNMTLMNGTTDRLGWNFNLTKPQAKMLVYHEQALRGEVLRFYKKTGRLKEYTRKVDDVHDFLLLSVDDLSEETIGSTTRYQQLGDEVVADLKLLATVFVKGPVVHPPTPPGGNLVPPPVEIDDLLRLKKFFEIATGATSTPAKEWAKIENSARFRPMTMPVAYGSSEIQVNLSPFASWLFTFTWADLSGLVKKVNTLLENRGTKKKAPPAEDGVEPPKKFSKKEFLKA